ncbi:histone H1.3 [Carex littledalei]|uniref:Histone H1.3 n=1 Tax=Carex littledalei TaxID=544730 RepID=A0A833VDR4_9POAL|nr:histone H1.3 [Carex littledalei]
MVPQSKTKESKSAKSKSNGESATKKAKKHESGPNPIDDEIEAGGACQFPMSRLRRLVRTDDPTTRTTLDSIFLINKASEMFLEKLAQDSFINMIKERKKSLQYNHVSSSVQDKKRYEFLSDFVPEKVKAANALEERASLSDLRS